MNRTLGATGFGAPLFSNLTWKTAFRASGFLFDAVIH